jgi:hypothetical protein
VGFVSDLERRRTRAYDVVIGWIVKGVESPVVMVIVIADLGVAQLAVALAARSSPRSSPCWLSAARASRIDVMEALRSE